MLKLEAKKREMTGFGAKSLIGEGSIPGEVYGQGFENIHISVNSKDFLKIFKEAGESTLISLSVDGKMFPVLINEVQKDVLGDAIIHIDFHKVKMDQKIKAEVPVHFIGEAPGVKEKGGVLVKSIESIEVEALPADLPHAIEINLESLSDIHQSIHAGDIKVPQGVKLLIEPDQTVATIAEPQKEEVVETPPTAEEEPTVAPETQESQKSEEEKK